MMMHGLTDVKFINAKQTGDIYSYKNIKRKLHKTIAAIWFNIKPEAVTAVVELLKMGVRTPEIC
jgi:hypothetical protein